MAELKSRLSSSSVQSFLDEIEDESIRKDCMALVALMRAVTKTEPRMWGASMVGFGTYHYKYPSGHEGDCFLTGFAPRKRELTLYVMAGFDRFPELMAKLGKHKTGKSCLYVKSLADIDLKVLRQLVRSSVAHVRKQWVAR